MNDALIPTRIQEGSLIQGNIAGEVRILAALTYGDFSDGSSPGHGGGVEKGEVFSFVTGHHLWLDDIDAGKDVLRALNLIDTPVRVGATIEFRYATMMLDDFTKILETRSDIHTVETRSSTTVDAFSRWSRRRFFNLMKAHFEDPLAFPFLHERIEPWRHPVRGFNLQVRFITAD